MTAPEIAGFGQQWLANAVLSTADRQGVGLSGSAAIHVGKTGSEPAVTLSIEDGRLTGSCETEPDVVFSFSEAQAEQYLAGKLDVAVAYMKGDLKPVGSTGALLAVLDVLGALHSSG